MKPVDYGIIIYHPNTTRETKIYVHQPKKDSTLTDLKQFIKNQFQIKHDDIYLSYEQGSKIVVELNQLSFAQFMSTIHIYKKVIVKERKDYFRQLIKSINEEEFRQNNEETSDSKQQQIALDNFPAIQKTQINYEVNDILAVDFVKVRSCLQNLSINIQPINQNEHEGYIANNLIQNLWKLLQLSIQREVKQFVQKLNQNIQNIGSETQQKE